MVAYSDTMFFQAAASYDAACQHVFGKMVQDFDGIEHQKIEQFLTVFFQKPVAFESVLKEKNMADGFPVWLFTFSFI